MAQWNPEFIESVKLKLVDYPFTSHWHQTAQQHQMHYLDEGSGEPVVMVHGNPTWSYYYRHVINALRNTHRCLVSDHIGMGLSDKPDLPQYDYCLQSRLADFSSWMDRVLPHNEKVSMVVHDWGGIIGLHWAVQHPERIDRLVILNTAAFPLLPGKKLPWMLALVRNTQVGAWLVQRMNAFAGGATWLAPIKGLTKRERQSYLAPYDTPAHRIATLRFVQDIPLQMGDLGYEQVAFVGAHLHKLVNKPCLIGWALKDFVFDSDYMHAFVKYFPQAEKHLYPNAGHYVLDDARVTLIPAIAEFMNKP